MALPGDILNALAALWVVSLWERFSPRELNGHQLFFFGRRHFLHLLDFAIRKLLNFVEGLLLVVFRDLLVFHGLLDCVIAVAAHITDCRAVVLEDLMQMLHHIAATLFGEWRDGNTDHLAVVLWIQAEPGPSD